MVSNGIFKNRIMKLFIYIFLWYAGNFYYELYAQDTSYYFNRIYEYSSPNTNEIGATIFPTSSGFLNISHKNITNDTNILILRILDKKGIELERKILDQAPIANSIRFPVWGKSATPTSDGNFIIAYTKRFPPNYYWDIMICKFNAQGEILYQQNYGSPEYLEEVLEITELSNHQGYLLAASSYNSATYQRGMMMKLDMDFNEVWTNYYLFDSHTQLFDVYEDSIENVYYFAGQGKVYSVDTYKAIILKVSTDGDTIWSHTYGGEGVNSLIYLDSIASDSTQLRVMGTFQELPIFYGDTEFLIGKIDKETGTLSEAYYLTDEGISAYLHSLQTDPILLENGRYLGLTYYGGPLSDVTAAFLMEFTIHGVVTWSQPFIIDPTKQCYLKDLRRCPDGGFVMAGFQMGVPQQSWVIKITEDYELCTDIPCIDSLIIANPIDNVSFIEDSFIQVSNNPVKNYLTLQFQNVLTNEVLYVYDLSGQLVNSYPILSTNTMTISTAHLKPGLYFLRLKNGSTKKIMKE